MVNTVLEVIEGPNKGQIYPIKEGFRIGSGSGDIKTEIQISGRNISTLHAKIMADEKGRLVLIALNPSRVFYVNSQKQNRVTLVHGQVFKMEDMLIRAQDAGQKNEAFTQNIHIQTVLIAEKPRSINDSNQTVAISQPQSAHRSLGNLLMNYIQHIPKNQIENSVMAFKNPLQMRFTQGLQFEESIVVGWGPRRFGKSTLEFALTDPVAPGLAFTLSPGPKGEFVFTTSYPNIVFINGQKMKKAILMSGDKIKVGDTIIEILELEYF
jgi:hypothetical protein